MQQLTANEAKAIVKTELEAAGVPFRKLTAKTKHCSDFEPKVFVKPVGAVLPDPRLSEIKAKLRGSGAILDLPSFIPFAGYEIE